MSLLSEGDTDRGAPVPVGDQVLAERIESLAAWIHELDARVKATAVAGDAKTLKELARALEAWSKHDPKLEERVTNRIDVLADRFATLAGTVNTTAAALAGKDGEIATLRRELEEGQARIEAVVRELRSTGAGSDVAELRKAVAALAKERQSRGDGRADALAGEVDVLAQRLDTLSKTVSTTAAGLAGKEGELAAFRARLEEGNARVETVVAELRHSLEALTAQVSDPRSSTRDPKLVQLLGHRLDELGGKVDALGGRVDAIATSVETTSRGVTDNEIELAALHRHFEDAGSRVDAMVSELRDAIAALPEPGTVDPAIDARLGALDRQIDSLTQHLAEVEGAAETRWDDLAAAAAAELARSSEAWAEEHAWVRERLESLAATLEEASPGTDLEPMLHQLTVRLEAIERGHESAGAEIERVSAAWAAAREELEEQLGALANAVRTELEPRSPSGESPELPKALSELATRLDAVEREGTAVAAEFARTQAFWVAEVASLEARIGEVAEPATERSPEQDEATERRIDELVARLDAVERAREEATASSPAELAELEELRVLVNGLRMRQASSEKVLSALTASGDISARVQELDLRLASLERSGAALVAAPAPVPGDGRFRMELRGLELRMEHLEAAARENRDAVLMQFERLASRLQWRLQQLEAESAESKYGPGAARPLGQVVPIRGEG